MTLEQIIEETRHWPPEKVGELVSRLTEDLHGTDPETEAASQSRAYLNNLIRFIETEIPKAP